MKTCNQCGGLYGRRKREALWQYEARRFCGRACADLGRTTTRVPNEQFKGRYRQVKVKGRKILEHRYVMEQVLGRPLLCTEQVHHKDHNRLNNDPSNLEIVTVREHAKRHTWRPITKTCVSCTRTFTPHKTKRARAQTCGNPACKSALLRRRAAERREARCAA